MLITISESTPPSPPQDASFIETFGGLRLSVFQQWAIYGINQGDHVLVTAHTGSGKTLPAEYAMQHFVGQQRRVIYASPIKALSNQKLYDLRRKFPHISFGLLTGDCKENPDADVLIMTTEILRNSLLQPPSAASPLAFKMNFDTELAAVIFDEVHYINDADRGAVWEQAIMALPPQVQMIMLSATIDQPTVFANWVINTKNTQAREHDMAQKKLYLTSTTHRVVPLTHYAWVTCNQGLLKLAENRKETAMLPKLHAVMKKLTPLAQSNGTVFEEMNYARILSVLEYLRKQQQGHVKRKFVLEDVLQFCKQSHMLPAIAFVFSRKQCESLAREISFSLFADDEDHKPRLVRQEMRHVIKSRLPNADEYVALTEFEELATLMERGIAYHHAGMLPVLREMVELMMDKGYVKLLFATETFAVGINMPTKTVLFTGVSKFTSAGQTRLLYPHEYTQMAGRAGRRGLDTVGHVIHCVNLYRDVPLVYEMRHLLTGAPQTLESKFQISYNFVLHRLATQASIEDIAAAVKPSLLGDERQRQSTVSTAHLRQQEDKVQRMEAAMQLLQTPANVLNEAISLQAKLQNERNANRRKQLQRSVESLQAEHYALAAECQQMQKLQTEKHTLDRMAAELAADNLVFNQKVNDVIAVLTQFNCIEPLGVDIMGLTTTGKIAQHIQEVHPVLLATLLPQLQTMSSAQHLATAISVFNAVKVPEDTRLVRPPTSLDHSIIEFAQETNLLMDELQRMEHRLQLTVPSSFHDVNFDIMELTWSWCHATDAVQCQTLLQTYSHVYVGEFVKAMLKIIAVARELITVCETTGKVELMHRLTEIPSLLLKHIVTTQSLYT